MNHRLNLVCGKMCAKWVEYPENNVRADFGLNDAAENIKLPYKGDIAAVSYVFLEIL
ncbi:20232_t:CDS:2 [Entrophospora sp. SA101]|nr:20232_t:CDS:2 [Entrophospora sp. SA101]